MLPLTGGLLDTFSFIDCCQPLPPSRPRLFIETAFPIFWNAQTTFEMIKHPQSYRPWGHEEIDQRWLPAQEERSFLVHFVDEFFKIAEELRADLLDGIRGWPGLELQVLY